jgi:5'-3' exonuclease
MLTALIDGDIIVYNVGYQTNDAPVEDAYVKVDLFINSILQETEATHFKVFLSDSKENNFRYQVAPEYKGNRVQEKPTHYDAIKEYLITEHGAKIAYGMEADDALGINQSENTIICSIDKDLDQIEGKHYKWAIWRNGSIIKPSSLYEVTDEEGERFFWKQMLIGDTSDNITGIPRIGKVKADTYLDPQSPIDCAQFVIEKYKETYEDDWEYYFNKNVKLLTILREELNE